METPSSSLRKQGSRAIAHRLPWIDRDRGTPRGATPPTPPSIRVRNTARRSLCPSSSSIWEHWKFVFQIDATRATCSPDRGNDPLVLEVGGADLVRSAGHNLVGREDSVLDEPADAMVRDTERCCGFRHRDPFAVLLNGTVGMDPAHPAHRADAVRGPGFSLTGGHSHPVQRRCDVLIRPAARHAAHNGEGLFGGTAAVL